MNDTKLPVFDKFVYLDETFLCHGYKMAGFEKSDEFYIFTLNFDQIKKIF